MAMGATLFGEVFGFGGYGGYGYGYGNTNANSAGALSEKEIADHNARYAYLGQGTLGPSYYALAAQYRPEISVPQWWNDYSHLMAKEPLGNP